VAKKPDITTIASGYYSRQALNTNFENLQDGFDNTLSLDGSTPNSMGADLDMNSNDILNAGTVNTSILKLDGTAVSASGLSAAGATLASDSHTGNGSTTAFSMSHDPFIKDNTQVYIDGVYQEKSTYSISGTTLTFSEAPPLNAGIEIVVSRTLDFGAEDAANINYTQGGTGSVNRTVLTKLQETVSVKDFGAVGDGVTDDTEAVNSFLTRIISTGETGYIPDGTYLVNTITLTAANGFRLRGAGTLKATGSNRRNMLTFNGVTGAVDIDEITIDGAGIVARPLDIQNLSATSSTLGYVDLGEDFTVINAKNNTPDTYTAMAVYIEGGFEKVVFAGEIDGVDSTSTSGASSGGLDVTWDAGGADDWCRQTVITSTARIKNIKNSNTVTADADGCRIFAPTTEKASLIVEAGATFEECKGRAIKSQVQTNTIIGAVIRRSLYDGLNEIDLQYSGGTVSGVQCFHDGTRTNYIISTSQYSSPDNTQTTITDNELVVTGSPASNTTVMIGLNVADGSGVNEGCVISSNRCKGTVDYLVTTRNANVTGNRLIVRDNWAEAIAIAYIQIWRYGTGTPNLNLVFEGNGAGAACTGGDLDFTKATIESFKNNYNISAIGGTLSELTISSGAITPTLSYHIVDTESDASTDDLDTITATYYDIGSELILSAANTARTVVMKDGTGNMQLAGDFSMDNTQDTIRLVYNGSNWLEVSRSNNGA